MPIVPEQERAAEACRACRACGRAAELRCTGCGHASYCTREHQKMDWKHHKAECKPFQIEASDELGRFLVANRDISPGELVLSELPLVFAPKALADPEAVAPCVGCYRPVSLDVGERCPSCGWPVCAGNCPGLKDMRHHGVECVVLSLRPGCAVSHLADYYRHDALMTLRCLISQTKFQKKYKKIMQLQSHLEDRNPDSEVYRETDEYIVKYLKDNFLHPLRAVETELNTRLVPEISEKLIHSICGIIDVNALDVRLNYGTEISTLYENACIMEHSCVPNTKHSFNIVRTDETDQFRITVRAVMPIKKGEHITTMYSHALWGTQARRQHLKDTKYFSCNCRRCKDPTELGTFMSAMKCLGAESVPCGGIQLPINPCDDQTDWACDTCPVRVKNSEVVFLVSQMGDEVDSVQAGNPTVSQLEDLIAKLSTFLHSHHYHLYSAKHSLVQLYGYQQGYLYHQLSDELLMKKADICTELLDITLKIDPGNSRLSLYTGVLYHELFQAKFQYAKRKLDKRGVTRNDSGEMAKELKMILKKAQEALSDEWEGSAGQKLLAVVKESEGNLLRWIKENFIS